MVDTRQQDPPTQDALRVSWITMPAAALDVLGAAIVVHHAANVGDMVPIVYATAFIMALFLLWVYHIGHGTQSRSRPIFVLARIVFGGLLAFILFDHSLPHDVYDGDAFVTTSSSLALKVIAVTTSLPGFALLYHYLILGRIKRVVHDDDDEPVAEPAPSEALEKEPDAV